MGRHETIATLAWLAVSAAITAGSLIYPFGSFPQPGPAFLPFWCGVCMGVLSAALFVADLRKRRSADPSRLQIPFFTDRWPKLLLAVVALFGYALLVEYLGFLLTTFLCMVLLLRTIESVKWWIALVEGTLASLGSYALFELWLQVQLPRGSWLGFF